jgi:fibrillarin-like pre-rRNA processing protein
VRTRVRLSPVRGEPRLFSREEDRHLAYFTLAAADDGRPVHGERLVVTNDGVFRRWEPSRSKLAAALAKGYVGALPRLGESWLYLGAASGTTASHVADLVGPAGTVYAVERSLRPFARLFGVAQRYPNLLPILADARHPLTYEGDVPMVDGLYADVAQPDQVGLFLDNAREFLRPTGSALLALKTASMGRGREARGHLEAAEATLRASFDLDRAVALEPFHKRHYLLSGAPTRALFRDPDPVTPRTPGRGPRAR